MRARVYFNPDGSPKRDLLAAEQAARDTSARRHGVDPARVASLLADLDDRGHVVLPELVPRDAMAAVKAAALPFLTHDGRNEIEGYRTRRSLFCHREDPRLQPARRGIRWCWPCSTSC